MDIVFDQEPTEGLKFADGKIYVNTKDPTLYQRLHQAAVERFISENGEQVNQNLEDLLGQQQEDVNQLFPKFKEVVGND